jgi:hypothetical protein
MNKLSIVKQPSPLVIETAIYDRCLFCGESLIEDRDIIVRALKDAQKLAKYDPRRALEIASRGIDKLERRGVNKASLQRSYDRYMKLLEKAERDEFWDEENVAREHVAAQLALLVTAFLPRRFRTWLSIPACCWRMFSV